MMGWTIELDGGVFDKTHTQTSFPEKVSEILRKPKINNRLTFITDFFPLFLTVLPKLWT